MVLSYSRQIFLRFFLDARKAQVQIAYAMSVTK
jgi:hypothetical protein